MTDLISKLADDLVALNNASPRLPRKEQIEEVLRNSLIYSPGQLAVDAAMMDAFPMYVVSRGEPMYVKWSTNNFTSWAPISQEQLVQAADDICAADKQQGCQTHHDRKHKFRPRVSGSPPRCMCGATKP